jgi:hypothetical protein
LAATSRTLNRLLRLKTTVMMNRRLKLETGELLFEKRGHRWALTSFAVDVYGETEFKVLRSNVSEVSEKGELGVAVDGGSE